MDDVKTSGKAKGDDKHCCVPLCNGNGRRHTDLSFHRFPQTDHKRNMWINAIRRDPGPMFNISDQTVVCSRHFKYTDFKWTPVRKTLKSDSVPSVFDWSNLITLRRELFKHPVPQKRPRPESDTEIEADDDISLGCEPYLEFQETNLIVCSPQKDKIQELEALVKSRDQEIQRLQKKFEIERFGINRFSTDNTMILFYTGFVSMSMFSAFFNFIKPVANSMTSYYYKSNDNAKQNILAGRQRNMLLIDELFMFLRRLKCGLMEQNLAVRFNCHVSTVSCKMITWANFLYFVLGSFNIWPSFFAQRIKWKLNT